MYERWSWIVRYVVVVILALVLGATLGEMDLFKTTTFATGLNAARLVQFLGYGGALLVFWLLGRRAAALMPYQDRRWDLVRNTIVPLTTLIVVACGQAVLLLVLQPLMNKRWHEAYNWIAITAIILSAAWLVAALFTGSSSLAPLFGASGRLRRRHEGAEHQA